MAKATCKFAAFGALSFLAAALSGCTTSVKLPLCPRLAEVSYTSAEEGRDQLIPRFLASESRKRRITITPLSYFIAEFKGRRCDIKWLERRYDVLLTEFNPKLVAADEELFISAHQHVRRWMQLVDCGKYDELMFEQNKFCPVCCSNPRLMIKALQPGNAAPPSSPH